MHIKEIKEINEMWIVYNKVRVMDSNPPQHKATRMYKRPQNKLLSFDWLSHLTLQHNIYANNISTRITRINPLHDMTDIKKTYRIRRLTWKPYLVV